MACTSKMIRKLFTALYADDNIPNFNENSVNAVFSCIGMCILNIDLSNIILDDTNYDEDDHEAIIPVKFLVCHI